MSFLLYSPCLFLPLFLLSTLLLLGITKESVVHCIALAALYAFSMGNVICILLFFDASPMSFLILC
jgi:hypothetical protein